MLLTLLNSNKEKIAFLSNIVECNLTQQINTIDKLEFTMPYADKKAQLISEEMYVQSKDDMYVIKALEINAKEIRCECRQDTELLSSKLHNNGFTSLTANISNTLNLAFLQTGYVVHTMGILTKKRTLKLASTNALDILFTAVKKFGFEFRINSLTKVVTIAEEFGTDKGTYFSDQLNAEEIILSTDTLDFATRLYCKGKDGLTFSDINNGKDYVENYNYSTKIVNKYWEDNRYTVKEDLLEDATKKLENLCKPSKSYSVSILDLASLRAEYNYLSFGLGDSITLINSKNKYRDKQRIVEINRDLINVHNINVTLANNLLSFEQLQERNEETSEVVEEIVNEDNTISGEKLEDKTVTNDKLAVNSITADNIKADSITSDKILAGAITSTKIETGAITAGSGIIAEGAIGDAQISKLSATKLSAGIIDASYIEVKNLNADNLIVGTINGERIASGAIDNSKVADNANISGSKLNINDVIVNINGASTQINGTKIQVGDRTLDAELSTQKIINNNTTETISKQASSISALDNAIKLKVDNQTYTADVEGINTKLNKNTTNIDLMQKSINLKVSQTDVENSINNIQIGGRNLLRNSDVEKTGTREYLRYTNLAPIFDKNGIGTYTISFDLKSAIAGDILVYYEDATIPEIKYKWNPMSMGIKATTEYKRYSLTVDISILTETGIVCNLSFYGTYGTGCIPTVKNVKIEKGNKATDWTPAPEDTSQAISTVNTKIDTQVAGININLDGITQKVSNTETDLTNFKKVKRNLYPRPTEELKTTTRLIFIPTAEIFKNHIGKSISVSFDMKCEIARPIKVYAYQNRGISIDVPDSNVKFFTVSQINNYQRFSFNTTIKDWGLDALGITLGEIIFYDATDVQNFSIKNINLEIEEIVTMQDVDTKVAETITNVDNITQRVGSTELKSTELDGKLAIVETRVNSAEQKLTPTAIMNTINTSINDGTGAINTTSTVLDKDGFTIKNGALKIKNKADKTVLEGDVDGNLIMKGEFKTFWGEKNVALSIKNGDINFYNAQGKKQYLFDGNNWLFNRELLTELNIGSMFISNGTIYILPAIIIKSAGNADLIEMKEKVIFNKDLTVGSDARVRFGTVNDPSLWKSTDNSLVVSVPANVVGQGFKIQTISGAPIFGYFAGHSYPIQMNYGTSVNGKLSTDSLGVNGYGLLGSLGVNGDSSLNNLTVNGNSYVTRTLYFIKNQDVLTSSNMFQTSGNLVMAIPSKSADDGFTMQYTGGAVVQVVRLGRPFPVNFQYNTKINADFAVSGAKNSLQTTEHYGERLINAYETAEYYFGDIGEGTINSQGECLVHIDEILQECINTKCAYQVFTQVYEGNITKLERCENYFIIKGEPNTKFGYELKAKRKGYENHRLEKPEIGTIQDEPFFSEDELKNNTSEETLDNILDFNLESVLL